ncbi:MAG: hypothetical protein MK076_00770 [Flavobacteriales bacterium]|nr:hypothetical protein [Flavobacteriales bacterium]
MFEIALTLASSVLEKVIEKRREKGKPNKAFKKIFTEKVNEAIAKLYQAHTHVLIEFEEELQNDK